MNDREDNARNETLAKSTVDALKQQTDALFSGLGVLLMEMMKSNSRYKPLLKDAANKAEASNEADDVIDIENPDKYDTYLQHLTLLEILKISTQLDSVKDKALIKLIEKTNIAKQLYESLNVGQTSQAKVDSFKKVFNENLPKISIEPDSLFRKFIEAVKKILKIKSPRAEVKKVTQNFLNKSNMFAASEGGENAKVEPATPENDGPSKKQGK